MLCSCRFVLRTLFASRFFPVFLSAPPPLRPALRAPLAAPGPVRGDAGMAAVRDGRWFAVAQEPLLVRGFEEPVTPYVLTPG